MNRNHVARMASALVLAAGLTTAFALPAAAAPNVAAPDASGRVASLAPGLVTAMQRDLGLTVDQIAVRLDQEAAATTAENSLRSRLGSAFGGAFFDSATGKLVVGVTDAAVSDAVTAAGATPRVVTHSQQQLDAAKSALDAASAPASVNGWYVDVLTNSVVVETSTATPDAATNAFVDLAEANGASVRTVRTEQAKPLEEVFGGDPWFGPGFRCSVGFSATGGGSRFFVTAGHCTEGGGTATGFTGEVLGPMSGSTFGSAGDFGRVTVSNAAWTLAGVVYRYDGTVVGVSGSSEAATGASICRSGSTTGWHCGTVGAKNQTVSYTGGPTVTGLTATNVCAEPGDSGGSFISGSQAQGMTSGGSGNCSVGGTTFFQPVNEALSAYGLSLVTG